MSRVHDKREEIYKDRLQDTYGYFLEALSESDNLERLRDAVLRVGVKPTYANTMKVVDIINDMQMDYNYPSEQEAKEELLKEGM